MTEETEHNNTPITAAEHVNCERSLKIPSKTFTSGLIEFGFLGMFPATRQGKNDFHATLQIIHQEEE